MCIRDRGYILEELRDPANVEAFRSSPFFWGFQKIVPGGEELASKVFEFTAGLPVAGTRGPFGAISQTLSLESGELVSEVEMRIFDPFFAVAAGIAGTVVSTANVNIKPGGDGDTLLVAPRTTRVRNANVGGAVFDQLVVPTSDLMSGFADGGAVDGRAGSRGPFKSQRPPKEPQKHVPGHLTYPIHLVVPAVWRLCCVGSQGELLHSKREPLAWEVAQVGPPGERIGLS